MRILFSFVGGLGHGEPLMPLARAARARGHDVRFACRPSMVKVVDGLGFEVTPIGDDVPDPTSITELLPLDEEHEEHVLRHGFADKGARRRGRELLALCEASAPDLLVADEVDYGAFVAAEAAGVPAASVIVAAAGGFIRPDVIAEPLAGVRAAFGLPPDPDMSMLTRTVVAPIPPSFRHPDHPLPASTIYTKPSVLEPDPAATVHADAAWSGRRPRVYVTLGTIFNMESGDLFQRVLAAVADLDADVLVTIGRDLPPDHFGPQPGHVRLANFVHQSGVLPGCDLAISHGGSGTVVGALACGVPLLVLPMGADQPHNARRCAVLGVGRVIDPVAATPEQIRDAALALLADDPTRSRAAALADEARSLPPAAVALDALETLADAEPAELSD